MVLTAEDLAKWRLDSQRLQWLHSQASCSIDADGYEWGIWRVKWEQGKAVSVLATNSDFKDLDAAIQNLR